LGSGGTITMGSGGTVALGSGGTVTLGSGGVVALGSGGTVALGSGGTIALGSGGTVTLGSGGASTNELDYNTANSVVRPPSSPTETQQSASPGAPVVINWTAPTFGVVATYTISRSSELYAPFVIGSVSGQNGNPPATTFTDTNPDLTSHTVVYTIATTLLPVPIDPSPGQSAPSPPAVITNNQTIVLGPPMLPSSVSISTSTLTVSATAESNGAANGQQVSFSAVSTTGACSIVAGSQSVEPVSNGTGGVSSATIALNSTGSCTITASQPGTDLSQPGNPPYYNAANSVSGTFTILPQGSTAQSQTINFPQLPTVQYGSTFSLSASSSSGLPVSFTASGPCTTSGSTTGVGPCTITASVPAGTVGSNTFSAASASQSFSIYPAVLTVTANNALGTYGETSLPALTFTTSPLVNGDGPSAVTGAPSLSTTATTASNAGNYPITVSTGTLAAANYSFLYVSGTLTIQQASQTALTLITTSPLAYNQSEPLSVTGGSTNGAVTYNVTGGPCTITGAQHNQLTANSGTTSCTVTATMAGNGNYNAVTSAPANIVTLQPASQTALALNTTSPLTYNQSEPLSVTGGSTNGAVTYTVTGGPCAITGALLNQLTANSGATSCTVTATRAGNGNYNSVTSTPANIVSLSPASQAITFTTSAPGSAAYNSSFTVAATGGASGNAVTFTSSGACSNIGATYKMTNSTGACSVIANQAASTNYSAAPTVTQTVNANGPLVTVSPSNIAFGTVTLGSITTKNITVTNIGTAPVTINQPLISIVQGGNSNEFVAVSLCPSSLAAGNNCTITIAFVAGPFYTPQTATLEIMDNAPGSPQPVTLTATVLTPQTITFTTNPPGSAAYNSSFTVAATGGGSGNSVTFTSSGACTNIGANYKMTSGSGTCLVIANQAGNSTYAAASQVTRTVSATQAAQTITFTTNPPASAAYNSSFTVAATGGGSGNAVTFTSSGACSHSGATYTMTGSSGTCSVIANQAGNSNYTAAPQVTQIVTAKQATQTITFTANAPASAAYNSSFTVAATGGGSGNAVTFTSSGACSHSGATYTMTSGTGTCTVIANQAGNTNYTAATQVTQTVTATQAAQTISFTTIPPATAAYKSTFKVAATGGGSGNAVTFTSSGACSNSGATYTMTSGTGTCTVIANQAGNSNYAAAAQVTKNVTATLVAQAITFTANPPSTASNNSSFTVAATGGASGNAVAFTSSGVCTNSGATYKMTSGTGTCSVIANQAGNSNYAAAVQVTKTVTAKP
jgi:phosphotransferase system HPr-like phosphotransfer protein